MPPRRQVTLSEAEIAGLIARSVAQALALRTPNSGSEDTGNTAPQSKPCTYKDFQNCKPLGFQGTEGAIGLVRWIEKIESVFLICNCTEEDKVKFAASTFSDTALTWWNTYAQTVTIATAYKLQWDELKRMLRAEYCPRDELKQLEVEFWNHKMQGDDITGYTNRFHQLALLCPSMVDPEYKRVEKYVDGLPDRLQDLVTSSKPGSIQNAIRMAHELTANSVRRGQTPTSSANKRKWEASPNSSNQISNKKPTTVNVDDSKAYKGSKPYCSKCGLHHNGTCPCSKCKKFGHLTKDCPTSPADTNTPAPKTCYECNGTGHFRKDCPKLKSGTNFARGRAYVLNAREEENPRLVDLLNPGTLILPKISSPYNFCLTISYFVNTLLDPKYSIGLGNDRLLESRQRNL